jgi:cysteine-rich repeat protein
MASCTSCDATCSATLHLTGSFCGDGIVSSGEVCDDGNTVTETQCPYGSPTCTQCNASCSSTLSLTGPYCGDGVTSAFEACDDGNATCGSCNATCTQVQLAKAIGSITPVVGSNIVDGETFTLHDGINVSVTFEFDKNGSSSSTRVPVFITTSSAVNQVAAAIAAAINGATNLDITAAATASTVELTNDWRGAHGNQPLVEGVTHTGFKVSGMSGGAGHDCAAGNRCMGNQDCAPSLACISGTCGVP